MISVLFTTSEKPLATLIRSITGEPVSHSAILWNNIVIHSNFHGINIALREEFELENQIIYSIDLGETSELRDKLSKIIIERNHSPYDILGMLFLGICFFLRNTIGIPLPKSNLWQVSGMYLCTEFVTEVVDTAADSMITPYKLYQRLIQKEN